jgi:hypothetical protein
MISVRSGLHIAPSLLFALIAAASTPAFAQQTYAEDQEFLRNRWWLSAGLGGGSVNSRAPAPAAQRSAFAANIDFGYRLSPQLGLGFDAGVVVPGDGCAQWECAASPAEFAPHFTHMRVFAEYRPLHSGWRFRAGAGAARFCYRSHWSESAWSWVDTVGAVLALLVDDYASNETVGGGSGAYRCDARNAAFSGAVSAGYDWPASGPVSMGLRLTAEAANFRTTPVIGLPAFRHRAVMLTLHVNVK